MIYLTEEYALDIVVDLSYKVLSDGTVKPVKNCNKLYKYSLVKSLLSDHIYNFSTLEKTNALHDCFAVILKKSSNTAKYRVNEINPLPLYKGKGLSILVGDKEVYNLDMVVDDSSNYSYLKFYGKKYYIKYNNTIALQHRKNKDANCLRFENNRLHWNDMYIAKYNTSEESYKAKDLIDNDFIIDIDVLAQVDSEQVLKVGIINMKQKNSLKKIVLNHEFKDKNRGQSSTAKSESNKIVKESKFGKLGLSTENEFLFSLINNNLESKTLIKGPSGYGKTYLAYQYAKIVDRPIIKVDCSTILEPNDWFGSMTLVDGNTVFVESDFSKYLKAGNCIVLLDELNRLEPHCANTLLGLLDDTKTISLSSVGKTINVSKNITFFATLNEGPEYSGTLQTDHALLNRFDFAMTIDTLTNQMFDDIFKPMLVNLISNSEYKTLKRIVLEIHVKVSKLDKSILSIRQLKSIFDNLILSYNGKVFPMFRILLQYAVVNKLDPDLQIEVSNIFSQIGTFQSAVENAIEK